MYTVWFVPRICVCFGNRFWWVHNGKNQWNEKQTKQHQHIEKRDFGSRIPQQMLFISLITSIKLNWTTWHNYINWRNNTKYTHHSHSQTHKHTRTHYKYYICYDQNKTKQQKQTVKTAKKKLYEIKRFFLYSTETRCQITYKNTTFIHKTHTHTQTRARSHTNTRTYAHTYSNDKHIDKRKINETYNNNIKRVE